MGRKVDEERGSSMKRENKMRIQFLMLVFVLSLSIFYPHSAQACGCHDCPCAVNNSLHAATVTSIILFLQAAFFVLVDQYINEYLVRQVWWPALGAFSEQVTLSDQKVWMEMNSNMNTAHQTYGAQTAIQEDKYQSIMDVMPYEQTCNFISATTSMTGSDTKSKGALESFTQQGLHRSMGLPGDIASLGPDEDREVRFELASSRYFDDEEMQGALVSYATGTDDRRFGADIDPATLLGKGTLAIDVGNLTLTADEEDVFALKTNLYNDTTLTRLTPSDLQEYGSLDELDEIQRLAALQAIAEYSFDSIVALKVEGNPQSGSAIRAILNKLGVSSDGANYLIGANSRPSYLQQLKILSKTMQSTPETHVDHVVEKTELMRELAIKEAIELMVKFEMYKSLQRSTVMMAQLHELHRRELQDQWEAQPLFTGAYQ